MIKVGIIGAGFARTTQIPGFIRSDATVVSIASGHRANAEAVAQQFGIEHVAEDWRGVVDNRNVDLVSIVSPPATHCEIALAAFDAGKAVLCEKPTALNASEAAAMRDRARGSNVLGLLDHELRFLPGRKRMRELIAAGEIGRIRHAKLNYRNDFRANDARAWNWWADAEQGGGALGAIGSHAIDGFRWVFDTEIAELCCSLASHVRERHDAKTGEMRSVTSDDEANLIMRLRDCAFGEGITATASLSVIEAGLNEHRLEVFGSEGAMMVDDMGELWISRLGEHAWHRVETEPIAMAPGMPDNGWSRGFIVYSKLIIDALREGRTTIAGAATFEDGYAIQVALDAARQSHVERRWISLDR